ncbi:MAG: methionine--tRNA ligase [Candidatus Aenigmatarchaeota archaeon]
MIRFKKFYVTTAIDYPNAKPHLGQAYEKIIADVIARFHRARCEDVFFLTGMDEHGQKIENAAKKSGKSPQEFVDDMSVFFKDLCEKLNISNDDFIRTTNKNHEKNVTEILEKVSEKEDIYKDHYEGLYCISCEAFYTEKDAVDGKCPVHKSKLEVLREESYFFRLSKYRESIIKYIKNNEKFIIPEFRRSEILNRLQEDLRDLSISRTNFSWGITLPEKITGTEKGHVIYVWFDALTNYATALCEGASFTPSKFQATQPNEGSKNEKYWPPDVQVIGKDILWFHTVIWPAILMSLGIPLPKTILVHGFINIGGEKLSKTRGIIVDPDKIVDKYGVDSLRYFLMREIPFGEDGNFSEESLINRHNSELADTLGNLVNRVLVLVEKNFDGLVQEPAEKDGLSKLALETVGKVESSIENFQFHNTLNDIFYLIGEANKYINENKVWEIKDKKKLGGILYNLLETLRFSAILLYPFIPETSEKIMEQLGLEKNFFFKDLEWGLLKPGTKTNRGKVLFQKIKV